MNWRSLLISAIFLVPRSAPGQAATVASEPGARSAERAGFPLARFRFDAGAPLLAPAGVAADGTICVGTVDGYIHVLGADGSYRWSYSVHGAVTHRPLFVGQLWYVATSADRIYALTRQGSLYWVFKPPSAIASELAVDATGLLFFVAADHFMYGVTGHGGVSLRVPFGEPKAGPSAALDGAVWAENQAGSVFRARGQELRRFGTEGQSEFDFGSAESLRDPEGHVWRVRERGVLEFSAANGANASLTELTRGPLLEPVWSSAARCLVLSARNGLVIAVDPPRTRQSR